MKVSSSQAARNGSSLPAGRLQLVALKGIEYRIAEQSVDDYSRELPQR